MKTIATTSAFAGLLLLCGGTAWAQNRETVVVNDAREVVTEIMAIPANGIPASLLSNAQGIVIVPDLVKGGFLVGARYGRGIAMVRDERGFWRPPAFVTLAGGSFGWQIGLQVTDIILVFKTRGSVDNLMRGKFTLGADAAAAAGPVGREAAAATDAALRGNLHLLAKPRTVRRRVAGRLGPADRPRGQRGLLPGRQRHRPLRNRSPCLPRRWP